MEIRRPIRAAAASLLYHAGLTQPARRGRDKLSIATFHRVLPEAERLQYPYPNLAVTPEELDQLLRFFGEHYDCGPLAVQHARYVAGEVTERPLLALTFDDGQHDNYLHASPVLARHRANATFFIPVAAVERQELLWHDRLGFAILALLKKSGKDREKLTRLIGQKSFKPNDVGSTVLAVAEALKRIELKARLRFIDELVDAAGPSQQLPFARIMTFQEINELSRQNHEIGSHSMTHCLMPECDNDALQYEVAESRSILRARTGQPIDSFCYPNGDSDTRCAQAVSKAGYHRAVTTQWGANRHGAEPFRLTRFDMDAARMHDSAAQLIPALIAFRLSGFRFPIRPTLR